MLILLIILLILVPGRAPDVELQCQLGLRSIWAVGCHSDCRARSAVAR